MELKIGDLVQHFHSGQYGLVITSPAKFKGCVVVKVQWCTSSKVHLIDVDFIDKINT